MTCWLGESEFNCPECDGNKEVSCGECGIEHECRYCKGTGWNPSAVDIAAFSKAEEALNKKSRDAGDIGLSWEWIEGDKRLGRKSNRGHVAIADFVLVK